MTSNVRLTKEICQALVHFKSIRKTSDDLQRKIQEVHQTVLDEQEQHTSQREVNTEAVNGSVNGEDTYRLQDQDYMKLKKLYKDAIKQSENEENVLLVVLAKLQDVIDKAEDGKTPKSEKSVSTTPAKGSTRAKPSRKSTKKPTTPVTPSTAPQPTSPVSSPAPAQAQAQQAAPAVPPPQEAPPVETPEITSPAPAATSSSSQQAGKAPKKAKRQKLTHPPPQEAPPVAAAPPVRKAAQAVSKTTSSKQYLGEEQGYQSGDKVAARVSGAAEGDESFWILASIVKLGDKGRYEVMDEDPGDEYDPNPIRKTYKLPKGKIIPLPKDFSTHKVHPKGSKVLAMFPNTTTFYPATVEAAPKSNQNYSLKFENDEEDGRTPVRKVKFIHVVTMPPK